MSTDQSMLVLTKEPFVGYMPQDVRALIDGDIPEKTLALLFARVSNKSGILFSELDEDDKWARYAFHEWEEVHDQLMEKIFGILIEEGVVYEVPTAGKYNALAPFMERNGYHCPAGWWVPIEQ